MGSWEVIKLVLDWADDPVQVAREMAELAAAVGDDPTLQVLQQELPRYLTARDLDPRSVNKR